MRLTSARFDDAVDEIIHWIGDRLRSQRWMWLLPIVVLVAVVHEPMGRIIHIMAAIVALGALAWAIKRPGGALIALLLFLPLQTVGFGFLLNLHVPIQILRPAGGVKELLGGGILLSALHELYVGRTRRGERGQLDGIDKALLAYVAVVTVYLVFPHVFTLFPVSNRWSVRLLAWRADCGYLLLFFAIRHAPLPPAIGRRFLRVLIGLAVLVVVFGLYQWLDPRSWSHLILSTSDQIKYQISVLGNDQTTVARNLGYLINFNPLRIGSIFLSPFDMADFLLIVLAIAIERIARDYRSRSAYLLCAVILVALFESRVRADALAAVIVVVFALVPTPNRPIAARLRLLAAILVAAAVVIPSLGGTRFVNAEGGAKSNRGHVSEITGGLTQLVHDPLGIGIGNAAGVGDRFVLTNSHLGGFTVDNVVLQVGDELGIQALAPWLLLMVLVWRGLGRAARGSDALAGGLRLAFVAIFIAGMYHQVFLSFPVTWTLWAAMALVLHRGGSPVTAVQNGGFDGLAVPVLGDSASNIDAIDATAAGETA